MFLTLVEVYKLNEKKKKNMLRVSNLYIQYIYILILNYRLILNIFKYAINLFKQNIYFTILISLFVPFSSLHLCTGNFFIILKCIC